MAGIYLHIPFCKQACHYCDFHFSTDARIKPELVKAMGEEILLQRAYLEGEKVETIYFGGGTPSLLERGELEYLLEMIFKTHPVSDRPEVTLEANPDDLTSEKLKDFRSLGVNRLSIGVQSFDDGVLRYLNRAHESETAIRSVALARESGFQNISIDLIYAIPGMAAAQWAQNIGQALALQPEHVSAYCLTIEEKTAFGRWLAKGKLHPVDEALAAHQQEALMDRMQAAGYRHYEISNFAQPGFESRHNSSYWKGDRYLGIGPSAHSYDLNSRQHNIANNHLYIRSLKEGRIPAIAERLKRSERINEYILTTLRTDIGCDLNTLKRDFSYDVMATHGPYIARLESEKLVLLRDAHLTLTQAGRLLADRISSDLFLME